MVNFNEVARAKWLRLDAMHMYGIDVVFVTDLWNADMVCIYMLDMVCRYGMQIWYADMVCRYGLHKHDIA